MSDIDPNTPEILFMTSLRNMIKSVGIDKMFEAMDYFKLMEEAVAREVFNRQNPNNTQKYKDHRSKQAFIKIFQNRYKLTYDIDYDIPVSDKDAHSIVNLVKKLEENKIPIDIYLEWYFEEYVPSKKQNVESICYPCATWVFQTFKLHNKDKMVDIHQKELEEKERVELFEKAKDVIRSAKIIGNKELCEEVIDILKKYNNSDLTFDQFRQSIYDCQAKNKVFKDKKLEEGKNESGIT